MPHCIDTTLHRSSRVALCAALLVLVSAGAILYASTYSSARVDALSILVTATMTRAPKGVPLAATATPTASASRTSIKAPPSTATLTLTRSLAATATASFARPPTGTFSPTPTKTSSPQPIIAKRQVPSFAPAPNARIWSSGFELGSNVNGVEWTGQQGTTPASIVTTTVHSGTYAMQANPPTSNELRNLAKQWLPSDADANVYIRFYLNLAGLATNETKIFVLATTAQNLSTERASIRLSPSGTLKLYNATTQVLTDSILLAANTWNRVEVHYNSLNPSGKDILEARVNGVTFATSSSETLGSTGKLYLGVISGTGNAASNLYFDDVAINDGTITPDSWPGEGSIVHLKPIADDSSNHDWLPSPGTDHFAMVDDVAPDDGSTVVTANNSATDDYKIESASTRIPASSSITLVQVGIRANSTGGTTSAVEAARLKSASAGKTFEITQTHSLATNPFSSNDAISGGTGNYLLTSNAQPDTTSPWTISALDSAQIGYRYVSGDRTTALTAEWLLVEYVLPQATASGRYQLPGRITHAGATITASPGGYTTTTAADRSFLLPLPTGTYTITASMPGYLPTAKKNVAVTSGAAITLTDAAAVSGDVDSTGTIDLSDLAIVGGTFGLNPRDPGFDARADINADGAINILDLVLAASHYGMSGTQTWP